MTTLLIIALIAGMLCVAAWKNPRYRYPSNTILGTLERIPGYVGCEPLQEVTWHDFPDSFNGYPWEELQP
jgi:hypothetical protein